MGTTSLALTCAALLASACGTSEPPPPPRENAKVGREETREIRNLQGIGVDSAAVADQVDAAIKANEERQKQLDAAAAGSE